MEFNPQSWVARVREYLEGVWSEFGKVTWPGQKEYVGGTIGVLIIVAFMTLVLGGLDLMFSWGFEQLIERAG